MTFFRVLVQGMTCTGCEKHVSIALGVASGKCGFTTLSPFSRRLPHF